MRQRLRHLAASLPRALVTLTALTSLSTLTYARSASAQADADRATARALGLDGSQALDSKDYPTAEDRFRRADRLVHAPTLMLGLARALAGEGKLVEATETYNRIVREGVTAGAPEPFKRALNDAKREVEEVAPKIGSVTIVVRAPGGADVANLKTVLDGAPLNSASMGVRRLVDPGAHTLKVAGDGFKTAELRFTVPEGGSINQPVTLEREPSAAPAPLVGAPVASQNKPAYPAADGAPAGGERAAGAESPEPSPAKRSALPWVAFGVGGAGLVVGAVAGIVAIGQSSTLSNACSGHTCPPGQAKGRRRVPHDGNARECRLHRGRRGRRRRSRPPFGSAEGGARGQAGRRRAPSGSGRRGPRHARRRTWLDWRRRGILRVDARPSARYTPSLGR